MNLNKYKIKDWGYITKGNYHFIILKCAILTIKLKIKDLQFVKLSVGQQQRE